MAQELMWLAAPPAVHVWEQDLNSVLACKLQAISPCFAACPLHVVPADSHCSFSLSIMLWFSLLKPLRNCVLSSLVVPLSSSLFLSAISPDLWLCNQFYRSNCQMCFLQPWPCSPKLLILFLLEFLVYIWRFCWHLELNFPEQRSPSLSNLFSFQFPFT